MARERWDLTAYPAGTARSVKAEGGHASSHLWTRTYGNPGSPYRAAVRVHRMYPEAWLEIVRFEFQGVFWRSGTDDTERLYWCPTCDGMLRWTDDQWYCRGCGNEWHDETIRPEVA